MAKRFMYVSIGVLCLVAAYQLGANQASAGWDSSAPGEIVGGHGQHWWDVAGQAWYVDSAGGFQRTPVHDLPVPAGSVKFMDDFALVTVDDVVWALQLNEGWQLIGTFPGPVPIEAMSWGKIKASHR